MMDDHGITAAMIVDSSMMMMNDDDTFDCDMMIYFFY
jgi:hypothetical protein